MKTVQYEKYGPPEVLKQVEKDIPKPQEKEVLIRVKATTVTSAEITMRKGKPYWGRLILGLFRPYKKYRTLGIELSGEITETGEKVTRFQNGDLIYGFTGFRPGANAEYICLPENASLSVKPKNFSWQEAVSSVDGASTAWYFLKDKAKIQAKQKVLIIGASGSIGSMAIQLAVHLGAEVTGICSTRNLELVKSLGAHDVVDYTREDFRSKPKRFDIIFDTVGKSSFLKCRKSLKAGGIYLSTVGLINYPLMLGTGILCRIPLFSSYRRVLTGMSVNKNESLAALKILYEEGKLRPVIDREFTLDTIIEAHHYVEKGHKSGNVVINLSH